MITDRIDPPGLALVPGSANVVVATGSRLVSVSGQTGVDEDGKPVLRPFEHAATADAEAESGRRRKKADDPERLF